MRREIEKWSIDAMKWGNEKTPKYSDIAQHNCPPGDSSLELGTPVGTD